MASLKPLPNPQVPLVDLNTGLMTQEWYQYFASRSRIGVANLSDVSPTAPTNGQVMIWNSTTGKWTPGAN